MLFSLPCSISLIVVGLKFNPFGCPFEINLDNRLNVTVKWCLPLAILFATSIGRLAKHRFFTPNDIDGSGLSQALCTNNKYWKYFNQLFKTPSNKTFSRINILGMVSVNARKLTNTGSNSIHCLCNRHSSICYWIRLWCSSKSFRIYLIILCHKWNVIVAYHLFFKYCILIPCVEVSNYDFVKSFVLYTLNVCGKMSRKLF